MSDAAGVRPPCPHMMGHGGASGDFRFSTRVLARVADAFGVVAVHSARVDDLPWHPRQRSRKATTDFHFRRGQSQGRALSGRGALHFPILVFSLSEVKTPGSRGLKPPAPRCLFVVALSIVHCRFPFSGLPAEGLRCRCCQGAGCWRWSPCRDVVVTLS